MSEAGKRLITAAKKQSMKHEWQIIARAILELADKAAQVNHYNGEDSVVTGVTLDPETERALRRIAEDTTDD